LWRGQNGASRSTIGEVGRVPGAAEKLGTPIIKLQNIAG
jgi:hypothetical protein